MPADDTIRNRVEELRERLEYHSDLYYRRSTPEISDREFDQMMAELIELEQRYPELITPDSPGQRVGGEPLEGFEQVNHEPVMLSLDNTYSTVELEEWVQRLRRLEPDSEMRFVAELKIDGVSMSLLYENRVLATAATRGNGRVGDDVTRNARTIRSIPLRLSESAPSHLVVRGEVYMPVDVFRRLNEARQEAGEQLYVNPRNTTAGTVRLLDSREVASRQLAAVVYDVHTEQTASRHSEHLELLEKWGFVPNPGWKLCADIGEVIDFIELWSQKRHDLEFETDGVVVKIDDLALRERLGATSKAPRWAVAFKYAPEQAETRVIEIGVQVGRTGALTPVAELEPVFVGGTTVQRATLHNYEDMARKDVRVGDTVRIEKGGDIIPKVVEVLLDHRAADSVPFSVPTHCPVCGHAVDQLPGEVAVRCVNASCPAVVKESIRHFVSRDAMHIEGLGERMIDQLLGHGLLEDYTSLYALQREDLEDLDGWGEISARNLISEIEKSRTPELGALLFALGIRFVGHGAARLLADEFRNLESLAAATDEELIAVDGVGDKVATSVREFFADAGNRERLAKLAASGVRFDRVEDRVRSGDHPLAGKRFVLTGTLGSMPRSQAKRALEAAGAVVGSSVSVKTDYLVAGEKAGSKLAKAKKLGVEVLSEDDLVRLLDN